MAIKSLLTSKMRAFLTMLGIIIGVGSVIAIMSLGNGMTAQMSESFASMGSNLITAEVMGRGSSRSISPNDMYQLVEDNPDFISAVSPTAMVNAAIKKGTNTYSSTTVTGVGEDYMNIKLLSLKEGRFINYVDILKYQRVCVIGAYVEKEYFNNDALGQTLNLNGYAYTVVGILEEKAESEEYSDDDVIYIPYSSALKLNGSGSITSYSFSAASENSSAEAKTIIENKLEETFAGDGFYYVMSMSEMLEEMNQLTGTMILVIACIAGISLLVGGIGIMNIMLVSVTERTREIGIRKALGAKRLDIRLQFIIESATTSAIGGIIGIIFGVALSYLVGNLINMTAVPSVAAVIVSFCISVGIGVAFGYLPANKAAKLNPIDALRYE